MTPQPHAQKPTARVAGMVAYHTHDSNPHADRVEWLAFEDGYTAMSRRTQLIPPKGDADIISAAEIIAVTEALVSRGYTWDEEGRSWRSLAPGYIVAAVPWPAEEAA